MAEDVGCSPGTTFSTGTSSDIEIFVSPVTEVDVVVTVEVVRIVASDSLVAVAVVVGDTIVSLVGNHKAVFF